MKNLPIPLYHRIYVILRERIINGVYTAGQILPAESEFMSEFGVARITVKRALDDLAEDGFVVRSRGRGTTVLDVKAYSQLEQPIAASLDELLSSLSAIGQSTYVFIKEYEHVPAGTYVSEQLGISPDTRILHSARVRQLKDKPFSYSLSYLLEDISKTFTKQDLSHTPLIDLIAKAGIKIERVRQTISCTLADGTLADLLEVEIGSPLLKLYRIFYDQKQRAINYSEIYYTPERFEYRMEWSKEASNKL